MTVKISAILSVKADTKVYCSQDEYETNVTLILNHLRAFSHLIWNQMSEYRVSELDPDLLATVSQKLKVREEQQRRHYEYLRELQQMIKELPRLVSQVRLFITSTVTVATTGREVLKAPIYSSLERLISLSIPDPYRLSFGCCSKYQQKLTHDMLVSLAHSLLDGTVFQIVNGMAELQKLEEENLYNDRKKLISRFTGKYL